MPVNLSIKNVPDELAERLRQRAERSHRSLQGELMTILTEAAGRSSGRLSIPEVRRRLTELALRTPSESAVLVREDREVRFGEVLGLAKATAEEPRGERRPASTS